METIKQCAVFASVIAISSTQIVPVIAADRISDYPEVTVESEDGNPVQPIETITQLAEQTPTMSVAGAGPATLGDLEQLTNKIVLKEIELLKLNTSYRIESTPQSKFKTWRQFFYNLFQYSVSNAGIDHVAYARWKTWQNPKSATKDFLLSGPIMLLVGHSIGVGGVLIEGSLDVIGDWKRKRKGFDAGTFRKKVLSGQHELDQLLSERDRLVETSYLSERAREVLRAEGAVLHDVRDCALSEFSRFRVRAAKWRAARDTGSVMSFAGATTGGYVGALMAIMAIANRKPKMIGPSGIGFATSGAFIVAAPVVTKLSSIAVAKLAARRTAKDIKGVRADCFQKLDEDRSKLNGLIASESMSELEASHAGERSAVYEAQSNVIGNVSTLAKGEARQANKEFVDKLIANTIIGGTKMAYGTMLMDAGFNFHVRPAPKPVEVPVKVGGATKKIVVVPAPYSTNSTFARKIAIGATCFIPGTATGILDTIQTRAKGEIRNHRLARSGKAGLMILRKRLDSLDEMEKRVQSLSAK